MTFQIKLNKETTEKLILAEMIKIINQKQVYNKFYCQITKKLSSSQPIYLLLKLEVYHFQIYIHVKQNNWYYLMKKNYQRTFAYIILFYLCLQVLCQTPNSQQVVVNPKITDPIQNKPANQNPTPPPASNLPQGQIPSQVLNPSANPNPTITSASQASPSSSAGLPQQNNQQKPQYTAQSQASQQPTNTNQPKRYHYVRENKNQKNNQQQYIQDQGQKRSLKEQINLRQTEKVSKLLKDSSFDTTKNYDFQLIDSSDFYVKSSIEHKYVTVARSYSFIDGNYKIPDRIQEINPIRITVYDEKGRKITSEQFSFIGGVSFDMDPGVRYQILFQNIKNQRGRITTKLVTVSWKNFVEHSKIDDKMVSESSQIFSNAAARMGQQAVAIFGSLHQLWMFDNQNLHSVNASTMKLFYWSVFEIIGTIIAAAIQVQIIRRLLRPASIVV